MIVQSAALLVYDVTDVDSFARVQNWVKELRKIVGTEIALCIAGNKCDLKKRNVLEAEAVEYAQSVGAAHFNTSAKLNQGVTEIFLSLTKRAHNHPPPRVAAVLANKSEPLHALWHGLSVQRWWRRGAKKGRREVESGKRLAACCSSLTSPSREVGRGEQKGTPVEAAVSWPHLY
jgi:50S ribosomal subunit-associated GTPase HflX